MMIVDRCGNPLVEVELFQFFFGRNAVEFLKHQKHRLIVNRDKSIVFAPEQRCMAVADLVADLCNIFFAACFS